MLIVLPPSETKAPGGSQGPMQVSFPSLDPVRSSLLDDLSTLSLPDMMSSLKLPASKIEEARENLTLRSAPVMPALFRYTGVLYDALGADSLPPAAWSRLAIGSALFGVVRAGDLIPRYRLSGGSKVPAPGGSMPTMKARWGELITSALSAEPFVVDLRSGTYEKLGPVPGAVTVRAESVLDNGTRKVVSHFNKHYKGELARVLALGPAVSSVDDVADVARDAGMTVEVAGAQVTLVV
ncbi:peroxide stress protein YaaA [Corynebacterium qintianiae]|uniref:Peroxide stress protein YaaA n=1 Tax=Corynebacterium qintianiae TaxID=2709392 RepID=A0A7T0PGW8_9CORY|nr:peroxide stress protein YaaA [Corynebacterium qintianiae]QPK84317.1 peroxide stress protein YaaA [Corynebacterium qintianiae]